MFSVLRKMRDRSRLEIYFDLVQAVSNFRSLREIARKADLPLGATKNDLGFLASQGFVRIKRGEGSRTMVDLTPKGLEVLEAIRKLIEREEPPLKHTVVAHASA